MNLLSTVCGVVAIATMAVTGTITRAADDSEFIPTNTEAGTVAAIAKCLSQEKEAVLLTNGVQCKEYRKGNDFLAQQSPNTPFNFNASDNCPKKSSAPPDARYLGADAIARLLSDAKSNIGSHGIRILGAVFCTRVNLVGLELPFSIVLDKAVFAKGIEIRNLHVKGDLSLDASVILDELRIIRSHIEGSLFVEGSFAEKLQIGNSTIDGSATLTESVLFGSTEIYNVSVNRELSVRGSALSYFVTQFSRIGEALDLSHSQARCAYHINKSDIGYLVARRAGFGTVEPPNAFGKIGQYYVWRDDFTPTVGHILSTPEIRSVVSRADDCVNQFSRPYRAQFYIFDSIIKSSLCVNEFRWLAPRDAGPYTSKEFFEPRQDTKDYLRTIVAINGNTIGSNLIIDLWPEDSAENNNLDYKVSPLLHRFEAIGLKAGGLVIDFNDRHQNHVTTAVDGLQFDRLYNGHASCEYGGSQTAPPIYDERTLLIISDFNEALELPKVEDALRWLNLNTIGSTQPYTAFATAFRNAGVDSTPITIARENRELCERAARWLPLPILRQVCRDAANRREDGEGESANESKSTLPPAVGIKGGGWSQLGTTLVSIPSQLSDLALLGFQGGLYVLADHGYRPAKVLWWVTLTLIAFWLLFLWPLNVVAYKSKPSQGKTDSSSPEAAPLPSEARIRPLGFLFLFDRLLPAYQIDSGHYEIESYFKRISISASSGRIPPPPVVRRAALFEWPVEQITDQREIDRIENWLRFLRILGVVFAIFLAAAVSALIGH
jgi:hypothetical protein